MNQEVQHYLRAFVCYSQSDWGEYIPLVQLALNNRVNTTIRMSLFFLEHGYNVDPLSIVESAPSTPCDVEEKRADKFYTCLCKATRFA